MTRIAIPIKENKLSKQIALCDSFLMYDIEAGSVRSVNKKIFPSDQREDVLERLKNMHVDVLIARVMSDAQIEFLAQHKILVYVGVRSDDPKWLLGRFMSGQLLSGRN